MRNLTFNKVYAGLLIIALISALILPKPISDKAKERFGSLFSPISKPIRLIVGPLHARLNPQPLDPERPLEAPRSYGEIAEENRQLRMQIANMASQLRQLQQLNADRKLMGELRDFTRPLQVVGTDPTTHRRSLVLQGDTKDMQKGMAVLYRGGLVGRLESVWGNSAQARLISDTGFRITAHFGRYRNSETPYERVGQFQCLLEGNGSQGMIARNVTTDQINTSGVAVGDWVFIQDDAYPPIVQGYRIGWVSAINPGATPQHVEITIQPQANLQTLPEVMVLVK